MSRILRDKSNDGLRFRPPASGAMIILFRWPSPEVMGRHYRRTGRGKSLPPAISDSRTMTHLWSCPMGDRSTVPNVYCFHLWRCFLPNKVRLQNSEVTFRLSAETAWAKFEFFVTDRIALNNVFCRLLCKCSSMMENDISIQYIRKQTGFIFASQMRGKYSSFTWTSRHYAENVDVEYVADGVTQTGE